MNSVVHIDGFAVKLKGGDDMPNGKVIASSTKTVECPICWRRTAAAYNLWHGAKIIGRIVVCSSCTNFDWWLFQPYRNEVYSDTLNLLGQELARDNASFTVEVI